MSAQKILQEDVNYLNNLLMEKKTIKPNKAAEYSRNPFAYIVSEHKIVPYDKTALTKQYHLLRELVADYRGDQQQLALFDQAIQIMDQADVKRK